MNTPPFKFPDFPKIDLFSFNFGGFNPSRGSPGEVVNFLIPDCELLINLKGMLFTVLAEPLGCLTADPLGRCAERGCLTVNRCSLLIGLVANGLSLAWLCFEWPCSMFTPQFLVLLGPLPGK